MKTCTKHSVWVDSREGRDSFSGLYSTRLVSRLVSKSVVSALAQRHELELQLVH